MIYSDIEVHLVVACDACKSVSIWTTHLLQYFKLWEVHIQCVLLQIHTAAVIYSCKAFNVSN